jgi:hypothetical protein
MKGRIELPQNSRKYYTRLNHCVILPWKVDNREVDVD